MNNRIPRSMARGQSAAGLGGLSFGAIERAIPQAILKEFDEALRPGRHSRAGLPISMPGTLECLQDFRRFGRV